jgi:hypothetical protein
MHLSSLTLSLAGLLTTAASAPAPVISPLHSFSLERRAETCDNPKTDPCKDGQLTCRTPERYLFSDGTTILTPAPSNVAVADLDANCYCQYTYHDKDESSIARRDTAQTPQVVLTRCGGYGGAANRQSDDFEWWSDGLSIRNTWIDKYQTGFFMDCYDVSASVSLPFH